ncbi:type VII secretion target [Actinoallomurus iriomotensis]|uniref:Uncharacterized protein n=1 Tax=Actinoallomurus iriomotensis TaxID=478107 RepID=A0A9W6VLU1_9ACTN|nr:type VII secretion target [Actinoallomurus iriomotensis]GLY76853.1 hypothetical protein Airi01_051200 [Actinoallomurus iriomotensis]
MSSELSVDHVQVRNAVMRMDDVAGTLDSLRRLVDQSDIPHLAFGLVGEGARHNYTVSRADELDNLAAGIDKAQTYADNLHKSADLYLGVEDTNVRAVLYDIGWIPDSHGAYKPRPPTPPATTSPAPKISSPADLMAVPASAAVGGSGALVVAALGTATAANLKASAGMSALTIGAALAWGAVVWSDDGSIDRALQNWDQVAREARALFGSDVNGVRQALQASWQGIAANSADGRMLEFVIAGMALADRAERRVETLRDMISQMITIHRLALVISMLMVVASVFAFWTAGASLAAAATYAQTLVWVVTVIEGLFLSWGMVAMWGDSEEGFALKGTDNGSAAQAVSVLTPPGHSRNKKPQKAPPPFSF